MTSGTNPTASVILTLGGSGPLLSHFVVPAAFFMRWEYLCHHKTLQISDIKRQLLNLQTQTPLT
jgi:hypothetical protein